MGVYLLCMQQARRAGRLHHGHLDGPHGAGLHGGPPQQQAAPGAGVGRAGRLRGRTRRHICGFQGEMSGDHFSADMCSSFNI